MYCTFEWQKADDQRGTLAAFEVPKLAIVLEYPDFTLAVLLFVISKFTIAIKKTEIKDDVRANLS